ncbi:hypothetical protein OCGS_2390 [Oceaniovalibus guishaninsula JLT2003]|uniref:Lysine transporter LysE n=1 Tax=Oceaniovalibus guishaninsula JLT2003 TaxID=1231392 RepID=K2H7S3_9RHOB|nr:LysE family transporter [Oceaniovalibus guishaninsula]EKE43658.1 hypothetical protein OCGS_2390 [Oceaniovalibus guishaninsula JLT2003]
MQDLLGVIDPAMVGFMFATTAFPGPNAVLMLSVGSRYGVRAGLPVLLGFGIGNAAAKGVTAAGMRWVASLDPMVIEVAQWIAIVFLAWFTIRILRRKAPLQAKGGAVTGKARSRPGQVVDGIGFQFCNPKVWVTGFAAAAIFCTPDVNEVGHAMSFAAVAFPCVLVGAGIWLVVGQQGARWLTAPMIVRGLDLMLVGLLALAAVPILFL